MRIRLPAMLAGLLLAGATQGAEAPVEEDLYLQAMQSIADGRQVDASKILARMIARGPHHAGEWLDLALIECALGHEVTAEALFLDIEQRFNAPQGIRDIIAQQRQQGCLGWRALSQWSLTLARGADSNINQGASDRSYSNGGPPLELLPDSLPRSDRYTTLSGDYVRDLSQNGDLGFVQLHFRQNDHMTNYNTASLFVGAERPWRAAGWTMRGSAMLGLLTLGGRLYQEQAQLQLRTGLPLALPERYEASLLSSLSYTSYKTLSNFDATTLELRGMLGYRGEALQGQLSLGYLNDQGNGARPGGDRDGWSLRLFGHAALGGKLQGELDLNQQRWNGHAPYSPGLIELNRRQDTAALRATLIYPLARDHALHLEWRQVRNQENISIFQYNSRQLQLSWHWYGL